MKREKPLVMPADRVKLAMGLEDQFPNRLGVLFSPGYLRNPQGLPFALDNGKFSVWSKGKQWDENAFDKMLDKASTFDYGPLWVVVPDVVTDASATFAEWKKRAKSLSRLGWPLALAVQDGMAVVDVVSLCPIPDVIFVGGSTKFKWRSLRQWTTNFPTVHVGRVNSVRSLWMVHNSGADSSDGTGWYHHRQLALLKNYLERSQKKINKPTGFFKMDLR